ncbi:protein of unknown function [Candidatus Promineifilum breve]|uniref:Uncharacterized protein n=1 Tax=Candidatus Promineifilum breve TaxID=1806508 RepID=A0A160SYV0_9CHLR|nr:protein of unknown function [Candidatus Promineifilum breve]
MNCLPAGDKFSFDTCSRPGIITYCHSSVAQWQSVRLLTAMLLVRVQPEEPGHY